MEKKSIAIHKVFYTFLWIFVDKSSTIHRDGFMDVFIACFEDEVYGGLLQTTSLRTFFFIPILPLYIPTIHYMAMGYGSVHLRCSLLFIASTAGYVKKKPATFFLIESCGHRFQSSQSWSSGRESYFSWGELINSEYHWDSHATYWDNWDCLIPSTSATPPEWAS